MGTQEQCRRVRNNAPPVESHCGAAENAADNYTAPPKSMPAGRAPGEPQLGVTVTPSTSLGLQLLSPLAARVGLERLLCAAIPWEDRGKKGTEGQAVKHGAQVGSSSLL